MSFKFFQYYASVGDLSLVMPISFFNWPRKCHKGGSRLGMLQLSGATVLASALSVDPAQGIAVPLQVIVEPLGQELGEFIAWFIGLA